MPKLNTTIDNLEWKSNKVKASVPSASWTDTQYPSAKTLYNAYAKLVNIAHPIGSILITATNTNPASTVGGTWTLVDKAFKTAYITLNQAEYHWFCMNADLDYDATNVTSTASLVDHSINIRLKVIPYNDIDDNTIVLGTLNLPALGITNLPYSILYGSAQSDGGNCTITYSVSYDTGTITAYDAINVDGTHLMPADQSFYINIQEDIPHNLMLDEFCDKFYWKRTA